MTVNWPSANRPGAHWAGVEAGVAWGASEERWREQTAMRSQCAHHVAPWGS